MKALLLIAGLSVGGCDSEPERLLTPKVFSAELAAEPSTATPDRLCKLVGADGRPFDLKIRGDVAHREGEEAGHWQIVEPMNWSAKAVASQFDMGLGGVSAHRWRTAEGDMSARVEWCDECPRDGTDSTIVVYDATSTVFAGVCGPVEQQSQGSDNRS